MTAWTPSGDVLVLTDSPSERPLVTSDELTLYFAEGPNYSEIYMSTRASKTEPFAEREPVPELVAGYAPSWLSADGCRLYFDQNVSSDDLDIVMAERQP
jgi:hypothetical protein